MLVGTNLPSDSDINLNFHDPVIYEFFRPWLTDATTLTAKSIYTSCVAEQYILVIGVACHVRNEAARTRRPK